MKSRLAAISLALALGLAEIGKLQAREGFVYLKP